MVRGIESSRNQPLPKPQIARKAIRNDRTCFYQPIISNGRARSARPFVHPLRQVIKQRSKNILRYHSTN